MKISIKEIATFLNLSCNTNKDIYSLNTLKDANEHELSFLENKKYIKDLQNTKAGAVLVSKEYEELIPKNTVALICEEPYINLAKVSKLFAPKVVETRGEEPIIGKNTTILPNVYLGKNSIIGNNCTIMSGVFIGDNVTVGDNTIIYPNVTIYRDCQIGNDCIIHAGTVIGSDGFGFANTKEGKYIKIYQNGNVIIQNDVEIGANCAIDRAVFKTTLIENGVRIDNLVHIGHNCKISSGCILAGQIGLSGSTTLHSYVVMGGQSGTAGHLEVAPFTTIAARGGVTKTINEPKKSWAGFPLFEHKKWLKLQGKISKLLN